MATTCFSMAGLTCWGSCLSRKEWKYSQTIHIIKSNNRFPMGICSHFWHQYWSPYWICTQHPTYVMKRSYLILRAMTVIHEINALRGLRTMGGQIPIGNYYRSFWVFIQRQDWLIDPNSGPPHFPDFSLMFCLLIIFPAVMLDSD